MDKGAKHWQIAQNIVAVLLTLLVVCYAIVNLVVQWPSFVYAMDSSWDFDSTVGQLDRVANGQAFGQPQAVSWHARLQNLLGKRASHGLQVIRGEDGELNYTNLFPYETYDFSPYAERMRALAGVAEAGGGHLLFLTTTDFHQGSKEQFGAFPIADFKARTDAMLYALQGYGVSYLDSRQVLRDADFNEALYRYKTDPTWTVQAGYEVFTALLGAVYDTFGVALDPQGLHAEADSMVKTVYASGFTGEFGRLSGIPFAGEEDFVLYTPAFETDLTLRTSRYGRETETRGSFEEALLVSSYLDAEDPYQRSMVNAYLGGQAPKRVILNHRAPHGPKVLLIGDGYAATLSAFLATVAGEVHYLWPYDNPFVEDVEAYIRDNGFDLVLMVLSPSNMTAAGFSFLN